jgi:hypothetical protein
MAGVFRRRFRRYARRRKLIPARRLSTVAIGQAVETELARPVTHLKAKTVGQATATNAAQPLTHRKSKVLGQATETELARSLVRARILGQATEVDTVTAVTVRRGRVIAVGQALEVDVATPFPVYEIVPNGVTGTVRVTTATGTVRLTLVVEPSPMRLTGVTAPTIRTTEVVRWPTSS